MQVASGHYFVPLVPPAPAEDQEPVKFGAVCSEKSFCPLGGGGGGGESRLFLSQIKHSGNKAWPFPRKSLAAWRARNAAATSVHTRRTHAASTLHAYTRARTIVTHAAGSSALERLRPLHRNPRETTRLARPTCLLATGYRSDHSMPTAPLRFLRDSSRFLAILLAFVPHPSHRPARRASRSGRLFANV